MGRRPPRAVLWMLTLAAGGVLALSGCVIAPATAAKPTHQAKTPAESPGPVEAPSSGLEALAAEDTAPILPGPDGKYTQADVNRLLARQMKAEQEIQSEGFKKASDRVAPAPGRPTTVAPPPKTAAATAPKPTAPAPVAEPIREANAGLSSFSNEKPEPGKSTGGVLGVGDPRPIPDPSRPAPQLAPATAPADERMNAAADELARALRDRAAASKTPAAEYVALAWLDTLRPGVLGSLESGPAAKALDPRQAKSVGLVRDMVARLRQEPVLFSDPERMWKTMTEIAQPVTQAKDVRITTAELCARVDGFGQYEPVKDRALLAGVPHSVIVYAEVDGYNLRKTAETDGERFTVDMGHAVEVWQDADRPTLQRRWSETSIKDVSRRMRRDFYITSVIELPPNLTVGAYNLKIIVKDRLRNAQAEKTIPFTIIADGAIVASGG